MKSFHAFNCVDKKRRRREKFYVCSSNNRKKEYFVFVKILINELRNIVESFLSSNNGKTRRREGKQLLQTLTGTSIRERYVLSISCNEIFIVKWWKLVFVFYHMKIIKLIYDLVMANIILSQRVLSDQLMMFSALRQEATKSFRLTRKYFSYQSRLLCLSTHLHRDCLQRFHPPKENFLNWRRKLICSLFKLIFNINLNLDTETLRYSCLHN